jgi:hypothetical protein
MMFHRLVFLSLAFAGVIAGIAIHQMTFRAPSAHSSASPAASDFGSLRRSEMALAQDAESKAASGEEEMNTADVPSDYADFRLRPFRVAKSSRTHEWTAEDGRSEAAIRALAHNPLEEENYKNENKWIERRQLVYRKEKVVDFLPELESGARKEITVPGFDGEEFTIDISKVKRFSSGSFGILGTVRGYPDSSFSLGSDQDREAMTLSIPSKKIRYEITPRETYEVVVSQINTVLQSQHAPPMGEPIRNDAVGN